MALDQESKKWREGLVRLRDRIDWLESGRDQRDGQNSMWTSGASGSVRGSVLSGVEVGIPGVGATSSCRSRSSVSPTVVLSNSMTSIHPEIFGSGRFSNQVHSLEFCQEIVVSLCVCGHECH